MLHHAMTAPSLSSLPPLFEALADPTRLRLINLLAQGEICVCYFVAILGEPQPKISRHLAYLRRAGLAATRRDGKWIHYRLGQPEGEAAKRVLDSLVDALRTDPAMQRDLAALEIACCAVRLPAAIADAPRPKLHEKSP
jgi:ArsR family transcriptional regulator, arsenate/arsenite/antimonite-responsive transcriptional repressor